MLIYHPLPFCFNDMLMMPMHFFEFEVPNARK
jgi:hypothetical protein